MKESGAKKKIHLLNIAPSGLLNVATKVGSMRYTNRFYYARDEFPQLIFLEKKQA